MKSWLLPNLILLSRKSWCYEIYRAGNWNQLQTHKRVNLVSNLIAIYHDEIPCHVVFANLLAFSMWVNPTIQRASKLAMFSLGFWVDHSKINKNLKRKHLLEVIFLLRIVIIDKAQFQHELTSNSSPFYHLIDTAMETWMKLKSSVCGL